MAVPPTPNPTAKVQLSFLGDAFLWFGKAWKDYCIASIPIILLFGVYSYLSFQQGHMDLAAAADPERARGLLVSILKLAVPFMTLYYVLFCGMIQMGVRQVRGEQVTWKDAFKFQGTLPATIVATLLVGLLTVAGFALCCIPALFVIAASMLTFPLVTDARLDPFQALKLSWQTAGRQIWACIGLMIIGTGVSAVSFYILLLGALIGIPVYALTFALVYEEFFGRKQPGFEIG